MGFSKGAVAAVYSAADRFNNAYGSKSARFAAHIGLYTPCNVAYEGETAVGKAPIRFFHGITDDYVPIAPCRDYVGRLKAAGADVSMTEYPDSPHGFDSPLAPPLLAVPTAQSTRNCQLREGPNGQVVNAAGQPYSIKTDSCVATGAHVGHNPETAAQVRVAVREFLQAKLTQ
jgi:dienelactone hydrolase